MTGKRATSLKKKLPKSPSAADLPKNTAFKFLTNFVVLSLIFTAAFLMQHFGPFAGRNTGDTDNSKTEMAEVEADEDPVTTVASAPDMAAAVAAAEFAVSAAPPTQPIQTLKPAPKRIARTQKTQNIKTGTDIPRFDDDLMRARILASTGDTLGQLATVKRTARSDFIPFERSK